VKSHNQRNATFGMSIGEETGHRKTIINKGVVQQKPSKVGNKKRTSRPREEQQHIEAETARWNLTGIVGEGISKTWERKEKVSLKTYRQY